MKLFTKAIDKKLFANYRRHETDGSIKNQKAVAKIFNPYGSGTWYIINSDPEDPDYLWAIAVLDEVEIGSVSRSELENFRSGKFKLPLERDLYWTPVNAEKLYKMLRSNRDNDFNTDEVLNVNEAPIAKVVETSEDIDKNKFIDYVAEFYGTEGIYKDQYNGGFTNDQIIEAVIKYLNDPNTVYGGGDSVDRELLRDKYLIPMLSDNSNDWKDDYRLMTLTDLQKIDNENYHLYDVKTEDGEDVKTLEAIKSRFKNEDLYVLNSFSLEDSNEDAEKVVNNIIKQGKVIYDNSGYIYYPNVRDLMDSEKKSIMIEGVKDCLSVSVPQTIIERMCLGTKVINAVPEDNEAGYGNPIFMFTPEAIRERFNLLITQWKGDYYESGFKYLEISKDSLKELGYVHSFDKTFTSEGVDGEPYSMDFTILVHESLTAVISFQANKVGKGGYSSFYAKGIENGYQMVLDIISKATYLKEVDFYENGYGAVDIAESQSVLEEASKKTAKTDKAVMNVVRDDAPDPQKSVVETIIDKMIKSFKSERYYEEGDQINPEKLQAIRQGIKKALKAKVSEKWVTKFTAGTKIKTEGESFGNYTPSLWSYKDSFIEKAYNQLINLFQSNHFEAGFKYMDIDQDHLAGLGFMKYPNESRMVENYFTKKTSEQQYEVWISVDFKHILTYTGSYSGLVSIDLNEGYKMANMLLKKASYVKGVQFFGNGYGGMDYEMALETLLNKLKDKIEAQQEQLNRLKSRTENKDFEFGGMTEWQRAVSDPNFGNDLPVFLEGGETPSKETIPDEWIGKKVKTSLRPEIGEIIGFDDPYVKINYPTLGFPEGVNYRLVDIRFVDKFEAGGDIYTEDDYYIDSAVEAFVEAGLWASTDYDSEYEDPLEENYSYHDVSSISLLEIRPKVEAFIKKHKDIIDEHDISAEQLGQDLFLTSQGHGAGFWDRGYGDDGDILTQSSEEMFKSDPPYVGDDDQIYFEKGGKTSFAKTFYIVDALNSSMLDMGYNSSSLIRNLEDAQKKAKFWLNNGLEPLPNKTKRRKVHEVIITRVVVSDLDKDNRYESKTDLIERYNSTFPLGEKVVEKPKTKKHRKYAKGGELRSYWDNPDDRFAYDNRIEILKNAGWTNSKGLPDKTAKKSAKLDFDSLPIHVKKPLIDKFNNDELKFAKGGQLNDLFEAIYKKYRAKNYLGTDEQIAVQIRNRDIAIKRGDEGAKKYSDKDISDYVEDLSKMKSRKMFEELKTAIETNDLNFLISRVRFDQKMTKELYEGITGNKLPKTNKAIIKFLESKHGNKMEKGGQTSKYPDWLFVANYPHGVYYFDKRKGGGDYHRIGYLTWQGLKPNMVDNSPEYSFVEDLMEKEREKILKDGFVDYTATQRYFYDDSGNITGSGSNPKYDNYAKGGEIEWHDRNSRTIKNYESAVAPNGQKAVGAFAHRLNGKYIGDYNLFDLNEFDKDFYKNVKLKDSEKLFRVTTEGMVGGEMPLVKVNLKNGRVYFMADQDWDEDSEKNPKFEKSSSDVIFLVLDEKLKRSFESGGEIQESDYIDHLNEIGESLPEDAFIMKGKMRSEYYPSNYGDALEKFDPVSFNVGFNEFNYKSFSSGGDLQNLDIANSKYLFKDGGDLQEGFMENEMPKGVFVSKMKGDWTNKQAGSKGSSYGAYLTFKDKNGKSVFSKIFPMSYESETKLKASIRRYLDSLKVENFKIYNNGKSGIYTIVDRNGRYEVADEADRAKSFKEIYDRVKSGSKVEHKAKKSSGDYTVVYKRKGIVYKIPNLKKHDATQIKKDFRGKKNLIKIQKSNPENAIVVPDLNKPLTDEENRYANDNFMSQVGNIRSLKDIDKNEAMEIVTEKRHKYYLRDAFHRI